MLSSIRTNLIKFTIDNANFDLQKSIIFQNKSIFWWILWGILGTGTDIYNMYRKIFEREEIIFLFFVKKSTWIYFFREIIVLLVEFYSMLIMAHN